jgi:hypothetical protein
MFHENSPLQHESVVPIAEALKGAAPRLFRPMYAGANMGHPSSVVGKRNPLASFTIPPQFTAIRHVGRK